MIYLGKVTRVSGKKVFASVPALGGGPFGPLNVIANGIKLNALQTSIASSHSHTITSEIIANNYKKGDRIVVAQVGNVKEDLIVLGRIDG